MQHYLYDPVYRRVELVLKKSSINNPNDELYNNKIYLTSTIVCKKWWYLPCKYQGNEIALLNSELDMTQIFSLTYYIQPPDIHINI